MVRRFDDDTHKNAARLGVSGTPVRAYYDDRTDGAWIFYTGVTGSGFKPDRLHDILDQLPAVHDDGAGDRTTTSAIDAEPGPHGGRAICNTVLLRTELLVTAVSTCSWFTPTTAAGITLIPKTDGTGTKLGFTAADVAPIMRAVRAEVEVPGGDTGRRPTGTATAPDPPGRASAPRSLPVVSQRTVPVRALMRHHRIGRGKSGTRCPHHTEEAPSA